MARPVALLTWGSFYGPGWIEKHWPLLLERCELRLIDEPQRAEWLDQIAAAAQKSRSTSDTPLETVRKINGVLFDAYGFRGNTDNYYDPRNSFFNDVLDRRVGIPITLSTVYIEVARRLDFRISGVGMPGHFLVKYSDRREEFFIDP